MNAYAPIKRLYRLGKSKATCCPYTWTVSWLTQTEVQYRCSGVQYILQVHCQQYSVVSFPLIYGNNAYREEDNTRVYNRSWGV